MPDRCTPWVIVAHVPLGKINGPAYLGRARITGHRGVDRQRALCPLAAGLKNRIGQSRIELAAEFEIHGAGGVKRRAACRA
jgi:hypothetical protein